MAKVELTQPIVDEISGVINGAQSVVAVSYTHLDVYKRQSIQYENNTISIKVIGIYTVINTPKTQVSDGYYKEAVSYTHLDVYKRQKYSRIRYIGM